MTGACRHLLAVMLLATALAVPAAQQKDRKQPTQQQKQQELKAAKDRIQKLQKEQARTAAEQEQAMRQLRDVEQTAARTRGALAELGTQRATRSATRQELQQRRTAREAESSQRREQLGSQLRAAYSLRGPQEPLQMLLNQHDVDKIERNLVYYGYLGRARVAQLEQLQANLREIAELVARIDAEDAELARIEQQKQLRLGELESARQKRGQVLASLEQQSRTQSERLAAARRQARELEDLVKELSRSKPKSAPVDPNSAFARLRNTLSWPVAGKVVMDFGEATIGQYRSTGIDIEAARGAEVRAIHDGVVEAARWVGLYGLMVVLDHGDGYYSYYGHNDQVFRAEGARVKAGEVIGAAGDSGGWKTTGIHFELRRGTTPVNPRDWFKSKQPPPR
jgi:septal ring factor EnvC (AmiA/AmiB activator)